MIIFVFLLLGGTSAFADSVDTAWVRRYNNGPGYTDDRADAISVDGLGNVYVTGSSWGSANSYDYCTIKYDSNGTVKWIRTYDGPGHDADEAYAIAVDKQGNVYVTGVSIGDGTDYDFATIKYTSMGDVVWVRRYNGPANYWDSASDLAIDSNGNIYVTGGSWGVATNFDYTTIKYNAQGDTLWVRRYDGSGHGPDVAEAILIDVNGNVCVTGAVADEYTSYDYFTIKYSSQGNIIWVRQYDGFDNTDQAESIATDNGGNVYVTGGSWGMSSGYDYVTIKYNSWGDTLWVQRLSDPNHFAESAEAIDIDPKGNVFVTGSGISALDYAEDYITVKYNAAGQQVWIRYYSDPAKQKDIAHDIKADAQGSVYVTGESYHSGSRYDYVTIKYDSSGNSLWIAVYDGVGNFYDMAYGLALDGMGNVYITGQSAGVVSDYDYTTIKYTQNGSDVKGETIGIEEPSAFALFQNYPNPFNQTTKIQFLIINSGFVSLNIYDILGRKVRTLVSENLSSGYKSVIWDGKNEEGKEVASGIYFYQLKMGDFSEPKKMLLLK